MSSSELLNPSPSVREVHTSNNPLQKSFSAPKEVGERDVQGCNTSSSNQLTRTRRLTSFSYFLCLYFSSVHNSWSSKPLVAYSVLVSMSIVVCSKQNFLLNILLEDFNREKNLTESRMDNWVFLQFWYTFFFISEIRITVGKHISCTRAAKQLLNFYYMTNIQGWSMCTCIRPRALLNYLWYIMLQFDWTWQG